RTPIPLPQLPVTPTPVDDRPSTPLLVVDSPVTPGPSALVPRISLRGRGTAPPPSLPTATGLVGSGAFVPSFAAMARSPGRHRGNPLKLHTASGAMIFC